MSKVVIPVSIDLGASLERIKSIEAFLLKLVPASNQTIGKFRELKDLINTVDGGALGKVPQVFKQILPPVDDVIKALQKFADSSQFVSALDQAVADATASILQFAQGSATIEELLPVLANLTKEAGGLQEGLSLLKDLPGFEDFSKGLVEGLDLIERFGDKATDINFDPNKTISTRLREAKVNLDIVIAEFGKFSPEADKAAEAVNQLNDELNLSKQLVTGSDLGGKFELAGRALSGVASAFQSVTALQAAFGDKSKETEEALKKVQAVMALTQGIEGLYNSRKAIESLGASGVSAFRNLTAGIVTATGASRGLAIAIAATGIGLLVVGIGVAISAIDDYNSKIDEAAEATGKLAEENERLSNALKKTFASSQPELNRQAQVIANEEKIKDLQAKGGDNQAEINKLRRDNLNLSIQSAKVELDTIKDSANGQEILAVKAKIFRDEQELIRIGYEETASAAEKSEEKEKKRLDELKKKAQEVLQVGENLKNRLKDIDFDVQFGDIEGQGLEQKLKAFQDAAKQYLKLGFSVDSAQLQTLLQQIAETKLQLFKPVKILTSFEVELQELINKDTVKKQVEEKIAKFRELKPILPTVLQAPIFIRTEILPPPPEGIETFVLDLADTLNSGIAGAFAGIGEAIGTALSTGGNVFEAVSKSLLASLGGVLVELGKQLLIANKLIETAKKAFGKGPLGFIASIALIALGTAIKVAAQKKSEKGFAGGGYIDGPGTETSDSIPARLSKGEYVIKARSVRKYGTRTMEKINTGQVPMAALARAVDPSRALVNRSDEQFFESLKTRSRAIVNRSEGIELFSNGGLVTDSSRGTSRAIVNRFEAPEIVPYDKSRALVNRSAVPNMSEAFGREVPYIATTKVSGQDLKIILERADRRYSNAT